MSVEFEISELCNTLKRACPYPPHPFRERNGKMGREKRLEKVKERWEREI